MIWQLSYFEGAMFSKLKSSKAAYLFSLFSHILYVFYYFNTTWIQTIILVVHTNGTYLNSRFHLPTIHNFQSLNKLSSQGKYSLIENFPLLSILLRWHSFYSIEMTKKKKVDFQSQAAIQNITTIVLQMKCINVNYQNKNSPQSITLIKLTKVYGPQMLDKIISCACLPSISCILRNSHRQVDLRA